MSPPWGEEGDPAELSAGQQRDGNDLMRRENGDLSGYSSSRRRHDGVRGGEEVLF